MSCPYCKGTAGFVIHLPIEGYVTSTMYENDKGFWEEEWEYAPDYDILPSPALIECADCHEQVDFKEIRDNGVLVGYEIETLERKVENVL